eukprot:scaffold886_cov249-Pinguiococcus_pyrenoidosus.AAC.1
MSRWWRHWSSRSCRAPADRAPRPARLPAELRRCHPREEKHTSPRAQAASQGSRRSGRARRWSEAPQRRHLPPRSSLPLLAPS